MGVVIKFLLRVVLPVGVVVAVVAFLYFAVVNRQININGWFTGGMTMGVDVSSYQVGVDFAKLREQGVGFAYIKATEGASHVDPSFAEKWAGALEAGMPAGAYHFFSYGESGVRQAENFIATVGDLGDERLIPMVDMELSVEEVKNPPEVEAVVTGLSAFVAVVKERYGVKPVIYSRQDYWDKYLAKDFGDYPRWVTNVLWPVYLESGDAWMVWQYNDCGRLQGYSGEECIDLDVVNNKFGLDVLRLSL